MRHRAAAFEKPGRGKQEGAGADRAEAAEFRRRALQPRNEGRIIAEIVNAAAAGDQERIDLAHGFQIAARLEEQGRMSF